MAITGCTKKLVMPAIIGADFEDAENLLEGFNVSREEVLDNSITAGEIIEVSLVEGEKYEEGTEVVVSTAKRGVIMPDVVGLNIEEAKKLLNEFDLKVEYSFSGKQENGLVKGASLETNNMYELNSVLVLQVEENIELKDIEGKNGDTMKLELEALGFEVVIENLLKIKAGDELNLISSTSLMANNRYEKGTQIVLTVVKQAPVVNDETDYLIIVDNEEIVSSLNDFHNYKKTLGHNIAIVLAENIMPEEADRSMAIRKYLNTLEEKNDIKNVLLIGDPYDSTNVNPKNTGGNIPMKYLYPTDWNHSAFYHGGYYNYKNDTSAFNLPSDLFYVYDIEWDLDRDGFYGEVIGDILKNGIKNPMFALGRIPSNSSTIVEEILSNIIKTEQDNMNRTQDPKGLIAAGITSYPENERTKNIGDGAKWGEVLKSNMLKSGFKVISMYENDGLRPSSYESDFDLSVYNVMIHWNKEQDFIYTFGHGGHISYIWNEDTNEDGYVSNNEITRDVIIQEMSYNNINDFLFMEGCSSSPVEPDWRNTTEVSIGKLLEGGFIAGGIGTTRELGFSPDMEDVHLARYMFNSVENGSVGEVFYQAIIEKYNKNPEELLNLYPYVLYGDPSLKFKY